MNKNRLNERDESVDTFPKRICVWTNMPNHYQSSLYRAIRKLGVDLYVCYFGEIDVSRVEMGWDSGANLPEGEFQCGEGLSVLDNIPNWRNCIHILTSVSDALKRGNLKRLCDEGVSWTFWDERGRPGLRWYLRYPFRRYLASKLTRLAEDSSLRQRLGEGGKKRANEKFTISRFVRDFENLYETCVKETRKRVR